MTIDLKTIKHISKLSRISVDEKKAEKLAGDLNSIFDFIEKLREEKKFKNADLSTRKSGSAALDMAYVASGRYDGFFQEKLSLWDIAAGIIIVKEAGGIIDEIKNSIPNIVSKKFKEKI